MKVVKGSGRGLASGTIPVCPEEKRKIARTPRLRAGGVGAKGRTRHLLYMTTYDYTASMADEVMSMKRCSDETDREEQKYWDKNLFQFHNIHHKSQVDPSGIQTGPPRRRQQ